MSRIKRRGKQCMVLSPYAFVQFSLKHLKSKIVAAKKDKKIPPLKIGFTSSAAVYESRDCGVSTAGYVSIKIQKRTRNHRWEYVRFSLLNCSNLC